MKKGDKLIAIDPCKLNYTGVECLTVGKEYQILVCNINGFIVIDDCGDTHHFGMEQYETYFQSITEPALLELGFERVELEFEGTRFHQWEKDVNGFDIEVKQTFSVRLHTVPLPNCKTLTDLKHLIRLLGV